MFMSQNIMNYQRRESKPLSQLVILVVLVAMMVVGVVSQSIIITCRGGVGLSLSCDLVVEEIEALSLGAVYIEPPGDDHREVLIRSKRVLKNLC